MRLRLCGGKNGGDATGDHKTLVSSVRPQGQEVSQGRAKKTKSATTKAKRGRNTRWARLGGDEFQEKADLWKAVATGDIAELEKAFREVDENNRAGYARRLLNAKPPPPARLTMFFSAAGGELAAMGASRSTDVSKLFPAGLTLLILAAGYWSIIEADSISLAESAEAHATMADEDLLRAGAASARRAEAEGKQQEIHESVRADKGSEQEFAPVVKYTGKFTNRGRIKGSD